MKTDLPITLSSFLDHLHQVDKVLQPSKKNFKELPLKVKFNNFLLKRDFEEHAQIKKAIIYRWYPTHGHTPIVGHVHFDVDGLEYEATAGEVYFLRFSKEHTISTPASTPHYRIPISATPRQLTKLRAFLDNPSLLPPSSCSGNTFTLINRYTDLKVSSWLSWLPSLSMASVAIQKLCGNPLIGKATYVPHKRNRLYALYGPFCEVTGVALTALAFGAVTYMAVQNFHSGML